MDSISPLHMEQRCRMNLYTTTLVLSHLQEQRQPITRPGHIKVKRGRANNTRKFKSLENIEVSSFYKCPLHPLLSNE